MKKRKYDLDYVVDGNTIYPLLFQNTDQFLQMIEDSEAGKLKMVHKLRA